MKKIFLLFVLIFIASCNQNSIQNPITNIPETQSGTQNIIEIPEEKTPELEDIVSDWDIFDRPFGEKIILEKDFCLIDICFKAWEIFYQNNDNGITKFQIVEQKEKENSEFDYDYVVVRDIDAKVRIYDDGERYLETDFYEEWKYREFHESEKTFYIKEITLYPHKNSIIENLHLDFAYNEKKIIEIKKWIFLEAESSGWCGGYTKSQKFVDKDGKEIQDLEKIFQNIPKTFENNPVKLVLDFEKMKNYGGWAYIPWYSDEYVSSIDDEDISTNNFSEKLKLQQLGIADYYAVDFKDFPNITFVYKNQNEVASRYLTGSLVNIETDENGFVHDLEATKKIILENNFPGMRNTSDNGDEELKTVHIRKKWDTDDYDGIIIAGIDDSVLPIFKIQKLGNGDWLLYIVSDYEEFSMAELCKPVVYVYDKNSSKNSLSVGLPQGGNFTKLIPNFSYGNTWDFVANNASKIASNGQKLDYLYYSARVPNYTFNENGWQVYGRDMVKFFEEKLDYIGFNATEKKDFIDFWKTEFHENTLYFVSFKFNEEIAKYATLDFARKPVSEFRVLLEAYPLEIAPRKEFLYPFTSKNFDEKLLKQFIRSGEYDVFEWGGVVQKDKFSEILVR